MKNRETLCCSNVLWLGGLKSRFAKVAGAEPCREMSDQKMHAVVARSAFRSQNGKNTSVPDHFWELSR